MPGGAGDRPRIWRRWPTASRLSRRSSPPHWSLSRGLPGPSDGACWRGTDADGAAIVVYPLQADGLGGDQLRARAAVAVKPKGSEPASWGVVWLRARDERRGGDRARGAHGNRGREGKLPVGPGRRDGAHRIDPAEPAGDGSSLPFESRGESRRRGDAPAGGARPAEGRPAADRLRLRVRHSSFGSTATRSSGRSRGRTSSAS